MSVAVIINPKSAGISAAIGRRRAEQAADWLAALDEPTDIFVTTHRGHGHELAAAQAARGARLVVAWGGDGTINEVASALAHTNTALGIIPSGSGNGLARELKIDRRPERALRDALGATPRPVDAGELGGRFFVNLAGVGFDAHVAHCFDRDTTGRRGFATYIRITVRELFGYRCGDYRVNERWHRGAMLITLANAAQFGNGARIAPAARIDDGLLDLVVVEEQSRLATVRSLPTLFAGGIGRVKGVTTQKVKEVVIESDRPIAFHVDGEPVMDERTRLVGRVLPSALRVAVR
jgi:YegS/Rv2252/BmrU family lipid kinase